MTCDKSTQLIASAIEGRVAPIDLDPLMTHLARCPACSIEAEAQTTVKRLLAARPEEALPEKFALRLAARLDAEGPPGALQGIDWHKWTVRLLPAEERRGGAVMGPTARIWLPMFTLVLFSAGIATGVMGVLLYSNLQPAASAEERPQPMPSPEQLTALLTDELQLTPAQQEQMTAIITARRSKFDALREQVREQFDRDAGELADDVQQILTPEQRKKFDRFVARMRAKSPKAGSTDLHPDF
jgi:Spy/CpxP family protein refolding chaperone